MRGIRNFVQYCLILLSNASQSSAQQASNPILNPKDGEIIAAGSTYNITWTPNQGVIVSIEIWNAFSIASFFNGANCDTEFVSTCSQLFSNITNTGSIIWHVPANAPISDGYYLDIYVPNPGQGGPYYYMTGNFSIHAASSVSTTSTPTIVSSTSLSSTTASEIPSAPTATVTVTSSPSQDSSGPSPGVIGGAVGGVIGALLAIGLGIAILILRKKKKVTTVTHTTSGRTNDGQQGNKIELAETQLEYPAEDNDERVGGRIRYPELDENDGVVGGRLRSSD